jgi:hypothetical protein
MRDKKRGPTNVWRFVGKTLAIIAVAIAAFWVIGHLFAFSRWAGFSSLGIVLIALYATAHRWVPLLPGLLVFGVINAVGALITHHAPTNQTVSISTALAVLLLAFYTLGCAVSFRAEKVSVLDRCAWVVYLVAVFLPAAFVRNASGIVAPAIAWTLCVGMTAIAISFVSHRIAHNNVTLGHREE